MSAANAAGTDHPFRRHTLCHPAVERKDDVVVCVGGSATLPGDLVVTKASGSLATEAVLHAGYHEEPVEGFDLFSIGRARIGIEREKRAHLLVIGDGVARSDGRITPAVVLNQLAAVSAKAAQIKGLVSRVAGQADILVAPDLESGNMLAKQLEYLGGAQLAGIVLGAKVPVILTSRADSAATRLTSCAVALLLHYASNPIDEKGIG